MGEETLGVLLFIGITFGIGLIMLVWRPQPSKPQRRDQVSRPHEHQHRRSPETSQTASPLVTRPTQPSAPPPSPPRPAPKGDNDVSDVVRATLSALRQPLHECVQDVTKLLQATEAVIRALPAQINDRVVMEAVCLNVEHLLAQAVAFQNGRRQANPMQLLSELERAKVRLTQLQTDARMIEQTSAKLEAIQAQLRTQAVTIRDAVAELEERRPYPVILDQTGPIGRRVVALIERMPALAEIQSHDALKRQLARVRPC